MVPVVWTAQPPDFISMFEQNFGGNPASAVNELREELEKENPLIPPAKWLMRNLGSGLIVTAKWVGRKLNIMFDEASKAGGRSFGIATVSMEPHVRAVLVESWTTFLHWLDLATSLF